MDILAFAQKKNMNDNRTYFKKVAHSNPSFSGFFPFQIVPLIYSFTPQICIKSLLDAGSCVVGKFKITLCLPSMGPKFKRICYLNNPEIEFMEN